MARDIAARGRWGRFYALHLGLPLALSLGCLAFFELTDADLATLEAVYDRQQASFPWRNRWLTDVLLHRWAKYAVILFSASLLGAWISTGWSPRFRPWRRRIAYVLLTIALGTLLTAWIKHTSGRYCPNELAHFGGWAPYVRLLEAPVQVGKPGGCFPCGHASTAFSLVSIYFALRVEHPRAARRALACALSFGFLLGAGRVVQGSHFPSHVLATAILCWLVALALHALILRRAESGR